MSRRDARSIGDRVYQLDFGGPKLVERMVQPEFGWLPFRMAPMRRTCGRPRCCTAADQRQRRRTTPRPVDHVLFGVRGGAGRPDVARNGCGRQQLGVLAQRRRQVQCLGLDPPRVCPPPRQPVSRQRLGKAMCPPGQLHCPMPPRQSGAQGRELTNRPTPCRASTWPAVSSSRTWRRTMPRDTPHFSTRAASLCGSPARGRGTH